MTDKATSRGVVANPTKRTRTPRATGLSDFGKAVHHHLIDTGQTLANIEKATGLNSAKFRKILIGEEKPLRAWITNSKLPLFLREASAETHRHDIGAEFAAVRELIAGETEPAPGSLEAALAGNSADDQEQRHQTA